jgi:hypothetical protein
LLLRIFTAFALTLFFCAFSFGEAPDKVTACTLKNDPAAYNHKLVEVEGFVSHGFEDFTFFDPNCPYSPMIWLEYGGTAASGTIYCCGSSGARSRPKELVVDRIPIPLTDDEQFRAFDKLLHGEADTIVHTTIVGRFFSGKREQYGSKSGNWGGYGHMGCCSLLAIQQVLSFDSHDRKDLDFRASDDPPDLQKLKCGTFQGLTSPSYREIFDIQHRAEIGENVRVFDDPLKVAMDFLAQNQKVDEKSITRISEAKNQGRVVYEWRIDSKPETYMVVVSKPYWLSFYAEDESKVAWVVIAAYKACGD